MWDAARREFFRLHGAGAVMVNSAQRAVPAYESFGFVVHGPEQIRNGVPTTPMLWNPEKRPGKT